MNKYKVIKRDGREEDLSFDKITKRINQICKRFDIDTEKIDCLSIIKNVIRKVVNRIRTREIDELLIEEFASMSVSNNIYYVIASKLIVSQLHKYTSFLCPSVIKLYKEQKDKLFMKELNRIIQDDLFVEVMGMMNDQNIVTNNIFSIINDYRDEFSKYIDYNKDYMFDYVGIRVLEKSYLLRNRMNGQVCERP